MQWFYNIKIRAKLVLGFVLVALISGIVGIVGIVNINSLNTSGTELYENMTVPISDVGVISASFQRMRVNVRDMILEDNPEQIKVAADKVAIRNDEIDTAAADFEKSIDSDEMRTAYDEFLASRKAVAEQFEVVKILATQNLDDEATALMSDNASFEKASNIEQDAISKLVPMKLEAAGVKEASNTAQATSSTIVMIIITIIVIIGAIGLGLFLSSIISIPLKKAVNMIKDMSKGHLGTRLNMNTKDEIGEMAVAMDNFADDLQTITIGTLERISNGDVSSTIEITDEQDEIKPALKKTIDSIRGLIAEASMLSQAAVNGNLDTRGNASVFNGGFKEIVEGVNNTLDALVGPLNTTADYINRIGKGEIPPKVNKTSYGDFNTIKNNINACIDGLEALQEGNRVLGKMSLNDYSEKVEGSYLGIYGEIADSINNVHTRLCRVVEISTHISEGDMQDLEILKNVGKRSENDHLIPSLVLMIEMIVMLVEETDEMARIAIEGNLNNRGDISRFSGEYSKVIDGFNNTLDAITAPIQEASLVLNELSQGNLSSYMKGNYQGQNGKIKDDMNKTVEFLKRYVSEITATLEALGQGNMDQEITTEYLGDFLAIKNALNDITTNMSNTMNEINIAAGQVEIGARQISDGGQALSQGTTEQASAIQELTASIDEIANETKKNALNANKANELTVDVQSNAEVGNGQMKKMVTAMDEINASSNNISKIIKVIDDIAFQTNILALNAAVEAARAGQHGKGFAVVAEEVRTLAARSAEAAKETTGLIEGSIQKVEVGTKIADDTAASLKVILTNIGEVADLVGNIAQASNDQASEIAQITQGIEQVSQVVQTNSATAEESAAASEELSGQAEMLKGMVDEFKLKEQNKNPMNDPSVSQSFKPIDNRPSKLINNRSSEPIIILDDMNTDKY